MKIFSPAKIFCWTRSKFFPDSCEKFFYRIIKIFFSNRNLFDQFVREIFWIASMNRISSQTLAEFVIISEMFRSDLDRIHEPREIGISRPDLQPVVLVDNNYGIGLESLPPCHGEYDPPAGIDRFDLPLLPYIPGIASRRRIIKYPPVSGRKNSSGSNPAWQNRKNSVDPGWWVTGVGKISWIMGRGVGWGNFVLHEMGMTEKCRRNFSLLPGLPGPRLCKCTHPTPLYTF